MTDHGTGLLSPSVPAPSPSLPLAPPNPSALQRKMVSDGLRSPRTPRGLKAIQTDPSEAAQGTLERGPKFYGSPGRRHQVVTILSGLLEGGNIHIPLTGFV